MITLFFKIFPLAACKKYPSPRPFQITKDIFSLPVWIMQKLCAALTELINLWHSLFKMHSISDLRSLMGFSVNLLTLIPCNQLIHDNKAYEECAVLISACSRNCHEQLFVVMYRKKSYWLSSSLWVLSHSFFTTNLSSIVILVLQVRQLEVKWGEAA